MKSLKLSAAVGFMILFVIACAQPTEQTTNKATATPAPAPATPDEFAVARANFARDCIVCHGEKGAGGPAMVDGHKLEVPTLRAGHALEHKDSEFVAQIEKGGDGMPAFKEKLKAEEINDLVRFIRREFQGGMSPPPESTKPKKGRG